MEQLVPILPLLISWFTILLLALLQWRLITALEMLAQPRQPVTRPIPPVSPPVQQPPSSLPPPVPLPPPTPVIVDQGLIDFIKKQEGYSSKAYWDYKQWTIGYGTKANSSTEVIDEAEATRRLTVEINLADKIVESFIPSAPKGVKQGMTDATYNLGSGWRQQELGSLLKAGKYEEAKSHLLQYNHAGGQVLEALTKRRQAEVNMFDNPL